MRVLYVIDGLGRSGSERSLASMAPGLVRAGVDLEVAYFVDWHDMAPELEAAGARLHPVLDAHTRLDRALSIRRLIRSRSPDLVHTTLFESDLAGRVAAASVRVPVVSSLVNAMYGGVQLADPRIRRWTLLGAQMADAVTARLTVRLHAVSATVADVMSERLHVGKTPIDVVPRGRDPDVLGIRTEHRTTTVRDRLGVERDDRLVLAVARHEFQKGLDALLEAFTEIVRREPRARLVVAGHEGSETTRLRALCEANRLGSSARMIGSRDDVADLLSACDVFVLPSRWEGFPGSLLEAMALRAPVVASDIGPVREIVDERSAALIPVDRPDLFAAATLRVLQNPDRAAARAATARARFLEHFTIERAVEGMVAFYRRSLDREAGCGKKGIKRARRHPT